MRVDRRITSPPLYGLKMLRSEGVGESKIFFLVGVGVGLPNHFFWLTLTPLRGVLAGEDRKLLTGVLLEREKGSGRTSPGRMLIYCIAIR